MTSEIPTDKSETQRIANYRHVLGFSSLMRVVNPRFVILSARTLTVSLVLIVAAMAFVPWQQTAFGTGKVIAYSPVEREQNVKAPMNGLIAKWHVQEGTHVQAGDLIVELSDNDPNILTRLMQERDAKESKYSATKISISSIDIQIEALRSTRELALAAADAHVRMAENKIKAAEQKLIAANAKLTAAQLNNARQQDLQTQGLTSDRSVELAEMARAQAQAAVYSARADIAASQGELLAKRAERKRKAANADATIAKEQASLQKAYGAKAEADAERAKAGVKLSRQQQMKVRAPRNGTIARVLVKQGSEFVKAGDPLALFVPDASKRAVAVWIDGNDVPLVHPGRDVRLQFEGWPAVQFSGWPAVAVGTFGGKVDFVDATADADGRFRVVVVAQNDAWPQSRYLRQGVRGNAWIMLNQVSLGYELWRQLNGFPPTSDAPKAMKKADTR